MAKEQVQKAVDFIFELNQLKREFHRGFTLAGVRNTDTVAEHSLRAAQIGYILASMENARAGEEIVSAEKVACMLIIHDNAEARVGDQHKVGARYIDIKEAEAGAFLEQIEGLGKSVEEKWSIYMKEYKERGTKEGGNRQRCRLAGDGVPGERISGPRIRKRDGLDYQCGKSGRD